MPRNAGPKSEAEQRYCDMIGRFLEAIASGRPRRARALARELDRLEDALTKKRVRELEKWWQASEMRKRRR
jgi:hypothetical protein